MELNLLEEVGVLKRVTFVSECLLTPPCVKEIWRAGETRLWRAGETRLCKNYSLEVS